MTKLNSFAAKWRNKNYIYKDVQNLLNLENARYIPVPNYFYPYVLFKQRKIK
jgi:hypothetical protein